MRSKHTFFRQISISWKICLPLSLLMQSCLHQAAATRQTFPANVGDISFDPRLDDSSFHACRPDISIQHYNLHSYFKEHKREIQQWLLQQYTPPEPATAKDQTGWLTIRFLINCEGHTGRFRMFEIDSAYHPFHFDKRISGRLLTLTRSIQGWKPVTYRNTAYDSYQYITFKLKKGAIECILP
jgi:hypothetical protein